jgi:hypothetical protein
MDSDDWNVERLSEALRLVSSRYRVIPFDEAIAALRGEVPLPQKAVAIAISLGSSPPRLEISRVARESDAPLHVYFTPGTVDEERLSWFALIGSALENLDGKTVTAFGRRWLLASAGYRSLAYNDVVTHIASLPVRDRYNQAYDVVRSWGIEPEGMPFLSWKDVKALSDSKRITLGVSGFFGDSLVRLTVERAAYEIREAFALHAERLGFEPRHFEYPGGERNAIVEEFAHGAGFHSALLGFSAVTGMNRFGANIYALTAQALRWRTSSRMRADLAGISTSLRPVRNFLRQQMKMVNAAG